MTLEHTDMDLLVHFIMSACVPHNCCLLNDDLDDSYFLDHHDCGYGDGDSEPVVVHLNVGALAAQAKHVQLMNVFF